ncbi:hypothetical protein [Rhizobium halophytocola]|uniref:Uncharacterized protein n=1 Tax=Rhizobium halophytocola TaxID=735519 RepID=A0ABS4E692_9HYPH|nr:hypothetical protein [Rhizobium halophytocola]MBP1853464.1 hypothetical protein [Rhizobium halophytocola]
MLAGGCPKINIVRWIHDVFGNCIALIDVAAPSLFLLVDEGRTVARLRCAFLSSAKSMSLTATGCPFSMRPTVPAP